MKNCPVCKGRVFDDMDTCYNCLHHFEEDNFEQDRNQPRQAYDEFDHYEMFETDCSPQWSMPEGESSVFKDYISKYCVFLNNYVKSLS